MIAPLRRRPIAGGRAATMRRRDFANRSDRHGLDARILGAAVAALAFAADASATPAYYVCSGVRG